MSCKQCFLQGTVCTDLPYLNHFPSSFVHNPSFMITLVKEKVPTLQMQGTETPEITFCRILRCSFTHHLFSVSSSFTARCFCSSCSWSSAIRSFSDPSCFSRSILFSCCSRINISLDQKQQKKSLLIKKVTQRRK